MTTAHLGDRVPPKRTSAFVVAFSSTAFCSSEVCLLPMQGRYDGVGLDERGGCVWRGRRLRTGGCSKGARGKWENPRKPRCIYLPLEQRIVKSSLSENLHFVAGRATFFFFLCVLHKVMQLIVKRNNAHTVYLYLSSSIATTRPKAIERRNSLSSNENRIGGLVYHTLLAEHVQAAF